MSPVQDDRESKQLRAETEAINGRDQMGTAKQADGYSCRRVQTLNRIEAPECGCLRVEIS